MTRFAGNYASGAIVYLHDDQDLVQELQTLGRVPSDQQGESILRAVGAAIRWNVAVSSTAMNYVRQLVKRLLYARGISYRDIPGVRVSHRDTVARCLTRSPT